MPASVITDLLIVKKPFFNTSKHLKNSLHVEFDKFDAFSKHNKNVMNNFNSLYYFFPVSNSNIW